MAPVHHASDVSARRARASPAVPSPRVGPFLLLPLTLLFVVLTVFLRGTRDERATHALRERTCPLEGVNALIAPPRPRPVVCSDFGLMPRPRPTVLIDAFLFNNEARTLLLRMLEASSVVDKFIVLEARETFTHLPKKAWYADQYAPCFARFNGQIVHVVVDSYPPASKDSPWKAERWMRDHLSTVAEELIARERRAAPASTWGEDTDILFMTSDLDEVPRAEVLAIVKACQGYREPARLSLRFHYYSFNWLKEMVLPSGPRIVRWDEHKEKMPQAIRNTTPPFVEEPYLAPGGWHMSYFLSVSEVQSKLASFSHSKKLNREPFNTTEWIQGAFNTGYDIFGRTGREALTFQDCAAPNADVPFSVKYNDMFFRAYCPLRSRPGS